MRNILLVAAFMMLYLVPSYATTNGNDLLEKCRVVAQDRLTSTESSDYAFCVGYVTGIIDSLLLDQRTLDSSGKKPPQFLCIPEDGITDKQVVLIVLKSL